MNGDPETKPTLAFVVCSVAVIFACASFLSAAMLMLAQTWNPCSVMGGLIMIPMPAWLTARQHRALFRRDPRAATTASNILFGCGGLAWFAFVTTIDDILDKGSTWTLVETMGLWMTMLVFGSVLILAGWIDRRESWRLKVATLVAEPSIQPAPSRSREFAFIATVVAFVIGLATYLIRTEAPQYAEHVSRDQAPYGLPEGASDVSYCRGVRGSDMFEFTIDEQGFRNWVASGIGSLESQAAGVQIKPITEPVEVTRFYSWVPELRGLDRVTITDGLAFTWWKEDRIVSAKFDRKTNRAYYYEQYH